MKITGIMIIFIFLSSTGLIAQSINESTVYPADYYIYDKQKDFTVLVGGHFDFILRVYGRPKSEKIIAEFSSPKYEIIEADFGDMKVTYSTHLGRIDAVEVEKNRFITSKGITIGSLFSDVVKAYGAPWESSADFGENQVIYKKHLREINWRAEDTYIQFIYENERIIKIVFYISSSI